MRPKRKNLPGPERGDRVSGGRIRAAARRFVVWSVVAIVSAVSGPGGLPAQERPQPTTCIVQRVVDGDTFVCRGGERVRLLLIDTPEMSDASLGRLAREFLLGVMPPGTEVRLELDLEERDRYRRLLAYVHLPDGRMVNELLAARGFAQTLVIPPNGRHADRIRAAVTGARESGAGLWGMEAFGDAGDGAPPGARIVPRNSTGVCHPSYPTVCVPPPPPDLDCRDLDARRFRVTGSDPHRFDGNGDGVGCEGP